MVEPLLFDLYEKISSTHLLCILHTNTAHINNLSKYPVCQILQSLQKNSLISVPKKHFFINLSEHSTFEILKRYYIDHVRCT
jgi:hypothetical protein